MSAGSGWNRDCTVRSQRWMLTAVGVPSCLKCVQKFHQCLAELTLFPI